MPFHPITEFVGDDVRFLAEDPCEKHVLEEQHSHTQVSSPCLSPVYQHFMFQKSSTL